MPHRPAVRSDPAAGKAGTESGAPTPGPGAPTPAMSTGAAPISVRTQGDVPPGSVDYALQRIGHVIERMDEPVLAARVTLSVAADPARARPALAKANLDLGGRFVGAHVAAHGMPEAVDLLSDQLAQRLADRAQRLEALHRRPVGSEGPGEWRHGDLPTTRPEYFDRPADERELVRQKVFVTAEQSADEAAFDMDQLDYDFYLFRDVATGDDSLLERRPGGTYRLQGVRPRTASPAPAAVELDVDGRPAPVLTPDGAVEQLAEADGRFVFFADAVSGRGCVVYLRYDGHYGLLTLA